MSQYLQNILQDSCKNSASSSKHLEKNLLDINLAWNILKSLKDSCIPKTKWLIVSSRVLTPPKRENVTSTPPPPPHWVLSLQFGGNSYYHSPFPNKNLAHLLIHSLTHSLRKDGERPLYITVVCPKH